ncbi:MAG: hypothetical protein Q9170_005323 [Blastenia crenularia]
MGHPAQGARVSNCSDTQFCCNEGTIDGTCCHNGADLITLGAGKIQTTVELAQSSTSSQLSTSSATSTAASTPTQRPPSPGKSDNIGVKVGAGVGISVGVLLVAAAIWFACYSKRQRGRKHGALSREPELMSALPGLGTDMPKEDWPRELDGRTTFKSYEKPELSGEGRTQVSELPARHP